MYRRTMLTLLAGSSSITLETAQQDFPNRIGMYDKIVDISSYNVVGYGFEQEVRMEYLGCKQPKHRTWIKQTNIPSADTPAKAIRVFKLFATQNKETFK